jgi:glycosyltransferase involved in cell wall biosynthesis
VDSIYSNYWAYPDEEKYGLAVQYLVEHKQKREALGMLGAMHVRSKFQWSQAAAEFETIMAPEQEAEAVA